MVGVIIAAIKTGSLSGLLPQHIMTLLKDNGFYNALADRFRQGPNKTYTHYLLSPKAEYALMDAAAKSVVVRDLRAIYLDKFSLMMLDMII